MIFSKNFFLSVQLTLNSVLVGNISGYLSLKAKSAKGDFQNMLALNYYHNLISFLYKYTSKPEDKFCLAEALLEASDIYILRRENKKALKLLNKAKTLSNMLDNIDLEYRILGYLAKIRQKQRKHIAAYNLLMKAKELLKNNNSLDKTFLYGSLAIVCEDLKEFEETEKYLMLEFSEAKRGKNIKQIVGCLHHLVS